MLLFMLLLAGVAFALQPGWLSSWRVALRGAGHVRVPLLTMGGPLFLLALLKWRRFDARVLLACVCVPHTPVVYDVVPMALVARTSRESMAFSLLTYVALFVQDRYVPGRAPADAATFAARVLNFAIYLPALAVILTRPNVSEDGEIDGPFGTGPRDTKADPRASPGG